MKLGKRGGEGRQEEGRGGEGGGGEGGTVSNSNSKSIAVYNCLMYSKLWGLFYRRLHYIQWTPSLASFQGTGLNLSEVLL